MGYRDYQCVFVTEPIWIVESFERATDMYIYNGHGVYKYVYRVIVSRVSFVFRIVTRGTNVSHFPLHRSSVFKYNKKLFSSFVNLLQPFYRPFESRSFLFPFLYFNKFFF